MDIIHVKPECQADWPNVLDDYEKQEFISSDEKQTLIQQSGVTWDQLRQTRLKILQIVFFNQIMFLGNWKKIISVLDVTQDELSQNFNLNQ